MDRYVFEDSLMKFSRQRMLDIYEHVKKSTIHPTFMHLAVVVFVVSIFGLRNVIFTPLLVSISGLENLAQWLSPLYWLGLILSIVLMYFYFIKKPIRVQISVTLKDIGVWLLLTFPFLYLTFTQRLSLDFWLDEVISIVRHIQPSVKSVVLNYPAPNNHIFSNLISNIYLQLVGYQDMLTILASPIVLRIPFLISGVFSILVLAYLAHIYLGKWAGYIVVVLFSTSIPFLNFIVQVRGYSFTLLFSSLILLLVLQFKDNPQCWKAFTIAFLSLLLFYTIPSNVYYILGLTGFFGISGVLEWYKDTSHQISFDRKHFVFINPALTLMLMLVGGLALGTLLYIPVIKQVIGNDYVTSKGYFKGMVFDDTFFEVIEHFISGRFWIFITAWVGVFLSWIKALRGRNKQHLTLIYLALSVFFLTFIISYIRGDDPGERVFLVVLPIFILLAAFGLHSILRWTKRFSTHSWLMYLLFAFLYLSANSIFLSTYRSIKDEIYLNLKEQKFDYVEYHDNRMWASHFLEYYQVLPSIEVVGNSSENLPVFLDADNTRYEWVIEEYLKSYGYPFQLVQELTQNPVSEAYIIVSYPDRSIKNLKSQYPETICEPVTEELSLYRVLRCQFP